VTRPKQSRRRARRWFVLFIAVATLAAAVWRFASTSISLDGFVPYLEAAVADVVPGLDVDIGSLSLTWAGWRRGLDLLARETRIGAGDAEIRIPEILLKLSLRALVRGRIAPSQVELVAVSGKLLRERDGTIRLIAFGGRGEQPVGESALERLLSELGSEPDPRRPLSYMRTLGLRDATMTFEDRSLGVTWEATEIDVHLYSALDTAVGGEFRAAIQLDEHAAIVDGTLGFEAPDDLLRVQAHFADVPVDAVGNRVPAMRDTVHLNALVGGTASVGVTLAGRVREIGIELDCGPGSLSVPGIFDEPEPLRDLRVAGHFDSDKSRWKIDPARLRLGTEAAPGAIVVLRAGAAVGEQALDIDATVDLADLTVTALGRYWPETLDPGTRKWVVERIDRGIVRALQASAQVHVPNEHGTPVKVENVKADFRYEGLRVRWGDDAPPVADIGGTATFADHALRFAIDGGSVDGVSLGAATVDLTELDRKHGRIDIAVDGAGTLAQVLRAIDLRPPRFIRTPDSDPALGDAYAAFRGTVGFHMRKGLKFKHLDLDVDADLKDVPLESDLARGTTSGRLHLLAKGGHSVIDADLDLRGLTSELRVLGWERAPEDEGRATFTLTMELEHPRELRAFTVNSRDLRVTGSGTYAMEGGDLATLTLRDVESRRTSLRHVHMAWEPGVLRVDIADGTADLRPLFGAPDTVGPGEDGRALDVTAQRLEKVWLHDDGGLADLSGQMRRGADGWQELVVRAVIPARDGGRTGRAPGTTEFTLRPTQGAALAASLTTDDFGGLVSALGWGEAVAGGTLRLVSENLSAPLDHGTVRVDAAGFTLADAPLAVRLLSLASLDSLVTTLQGGNLFFDELGGEIEIDGGRLGLVDVRANGSSLGWLAQGGVDLGDDSLAIAGTLIPAYTANRFLQSLPVLREVIVGEGILAVDFEIAGTLAEPTIDTKPLSAITPELLRRVFGRATRAPRKSP
jgi:hypothetical protein